MLPTNCHWTLILYHATVSGIYLGVIDINKSQPVYYLEYKKMVLLISKEFVKSAFFILLLFLPAAISAQSTIPEKLYVFLGAQEIWVPNVPGVYLSGPDAPEREHYPSEPISRTGVNGEELRMYPFIGEPPYYAETLGIERGNGIAEILLSLGLYNELNGITHIRMSKPHDGDPFCCRPEFEDIKKTPSPISGFYYSGNPNYTTKSYVSDELTLFGYYISAACTEGFDGKTELTRCSIRGQMPNGSSIRLIVYANDEREDAWPPIERASEEWPALLTSVEKLMLSFLAP